MTSSPDSLQELFNSDVFQSIEVRFSISNTTTRTDFKEQPEAKIDEITDAGLVLEVPGKCCSVGHSLLIEASATPPKGEKFRFSVTARVENLETLGAGTDRVSLTLMQFKEDDWKRFRHLFSQRQDEITQFLNSSRGYG